MYEGQVSTKKEAGLKDLHSCWLAGLVGDICRAELQDTATPFLQRKTRMPVRSSAMISPPQFHGGLANHVFGQIRSASTPPFGPLISVI
jgi:hypothetical protein